MPPRIRAPLFFPISSIISRGDISFMSEILYLSSREAGAIFFNFSINFKARVSLSIISSFMAPVKARLSPTFSSNFGHKTPGVSRRWSFEWIFIHWFVFVTPGLLPVLADFVPEIEFIKVDFPEFGMPTIIARSGPFLSPLSWYFFISSAMSSSDFFTTKFTLGFMAL